MMADHWLLKDGKQIVVVTGDGKPSVIATVKNERAVRQMLRYTQMAQDIERECDKAIGAGGREMPMLLARILMLVGECIKDTDSTKVEQPCPTYEKEA